jgi:hypothetical protein
MTNKETRSKVFVSYSHVDSKWLKRLQVHLRPLEKEFETEIWDDTKIKPGNQWKKEIDIALSHAKAAILLISADFLASEFITKYELPNLLEKSQKDGTFIISILLSPSRFKRTKLSEFQAVNSPDDPITSMSQNDQEATFDKVAEMIEGIFEPRGAKVAIGHSLQLESTETKGFLSKTEIIDVIIKSKTFAENEKIEKTILIYSTETQQTWLVSTRTRVYCILNENGTPKPNQTISWVSDKESLKPVGIRKYKKYSGLLDLHNHAAWLYTYRLFPKPDDLIKEVNELLT